jgi:hypothetical protein
VGGVHPHALDELQPVHDWHVDVRQDDVELAGSELPQPVDAVVRLGDAQIADTSERKHDELPHHRGVFYDQAGVFGHRAPLGSALARVQ